MDPQQCMPLLSINEHKDVVRVILKLDNGYFISCSHDGSIKLWNIENPKKMIRRLSINNEFVINVIKIGNSNLVLSVHSRGYVCIWRLTNGLCIKRIQICTKEIYCAINLLDYNLIAFGISTGRVIIYDVFTSTSIFSFDEENSISSLYYNNHNLFVATRDKEINIYPLQEVNNFKEADQAFFKQNRRQIKIQYICSCMTLVDSQIFIVGTTEGYIFVFKLEQTDYTFIKEVIAHRQTVINLKFLENSKIVFFSLKYLLISNFLFLKDLYSTGYDGCVIKWDIINFSKLIRYFGHRYAVYAINIIGDYLITAGADQQILIWNHKVQDTQSVNNNKIILKAD